MRKPLPHIWLVSALPAHTSQVLLVLEEKYTVEVLLPSQVLRTSAFPSLIFLHFIQHSSLEYRLLEALRKDAPKSQIFVLGDQPENEYIIRAYDKGADAYLLLPLQWNELLAKIRPPRRWYQWLFGLAQRWRKKKPRLHPPISALPINKLVPDVSYDLNVRFLGDFSVKNSAQEVLDLKSSRIQAVFACLLYHGHKGVSRNQLIDNFWPEVTEDSARNSLNVAISQLRANLRAYFHQCESIVFEQGNYHICNELSITTDVALFQHCIKSAKANLAHESLVDITPFLRAVDIYQGDFLATFNFHEWTTPIRDRLWEHYLFALGKLVAHYLKEEQYQEATRFAKLLLQQDSCHELTHRQLMYAYYRLGKRTSALQQYLVCKAILIADLNVKPSKETEELYQIIVKQERRKVSFPLV